jgi:DNA polymerase-3 subunit epsilon
MQRFALRRIQGSWLDLADLAPALLPDLAPQCQTLDDWLSALHIPNPARHRAAGDAFATAQLLVRLCANMAETKTALDLFKLARAHRQLALLRSTMR